MSDTLAAKLSSAIPVPAPAPEVVQAPKAAPNPTTQEAPPADLTPAEKKIWKLKADGEEFEFDASNEEAIKREIMKARGADKRFKEAAAQRQQSEQFLAMLKDPKQLKSLLSDPRIGVDVKQFAEDLVWEQIQESQLTPEQKRQRELEQDYKRLKEREDHEQKSVKEREAMQRQAQYEAHYEKTILKALDVKGIPKDQFTVMKMADYMLTAVKEGIDLSAEDVADLIKQDNASYFKAHTEQMDEDQLFALLGDHGAEKLRKADLKRLRSPTANPFPERMPRAAQKDHQPKKQAGSDWRRDKIADFLARN